MSKGQQTREAILAAAFEQSRVAGLEAISIGGLARSVGLSKSGLFAHFQSKEALQLALLDHAASLFTAEVVVPALRSPRGEPRVLALFDRWMAWSASAVRHGGCIFIAAASEYDDRPGPVRQHVCDTVQQWVQAIAKAAQIAKDCGHFRSDLDTQQFAFEVEALCTGFHLYARLLDDEQATNRCRTAFHAIVARARVPSRSS